MRSAAQWMDGRKRAAYQCGGRDMSAIFNATAEMAGGTLQCEASAKPK